MCPECGQAKREVMGCGCIGLRSMGLAARMSGSGEVFLRSAKLDELDKRTGAPPIPIFMNANVGSKVKKVERQPHARYDFGNHANQFTKEYCYLQYQLHPHKRYAINRIRAVWSAGASFGQASHRRTQVMRIASRSCNIFGMPLMLTILAALSMSTSMWGQQAPEVNVGDVRISGLPDDWTHRHLFFANPGSADEASRKGVFEQWLKVGNDPRYVMHQLKRRYPAQGLAADAVQMRFIQAEGVAGTRPAPVLPPIRRLRPTMHRDWSAPLITGAVLPNTFPAKYSFSTASTPDCTNDYVVYPTGSTGAATAATITAYNNLYATTCAGIVPSVYWAYNTGAAAVTTSPVLSLDGTQVAFVQSTGTAASLVLLKWNPNTTGRVVTGSLAVASPNVTLAAGTFTSADVGAQITGTGIPAGDTISSVLTPTTATLATAPTAQAAEALTIAAETVAAPGVPPAVSNANYRTCTAPCMTTIAFSGSANDTNSSPFYDYNTDTIYVGDNSSKLHKFTNVFNGTPAEVTPVVTLNATVYTVSSPVYDPVSGCVFVGDSQGYLYSVNSGTPGTVCTSGTFALWGRSAILGNAAANDGIFDAPLVDSTAGRVYAFVTASKTMTATGTCAANNNCLVEFATSTITSGSTTAAPVVVQPLGTGGANYKVYAGTFDNVYFSSADGSNPSGNLYVVGNTNVNGAGRLYRVPITNNAIGTPVNLATLNSGNRVWGSPITEFCNNGASPCAVTGGVTTSGTDRIFFSVNRGSATGCTNTIGHGCVLAYNVSNPASVSFIAGLSITATTNPGCWSTGGLIIDNSSTTTGESQVYFVNLNGNSPAARPTTCSAAVTNRTIQAVQASQAALQ